MATLREKNGYNFVDYRVNGLRVRKSVGKSKRIAEIARKDIELKVARNEAGLEPKDSELAKLFTNYLNELICLRAMFNLAIKWVYVRDNPTSNFAFLKEEMNKKPCFFSKEEYKILLKNAYAFLYPVFYTLLYTGMRKSKLKNLVWRDVDFERRKIKIRYKDDWSPKSSGREIPMNKGLYDLLKDHKAKTQLKTCRYVFHQQGEQIEPNFLRNHLLPLTKKCGFGDVTKIHSLRHTFASHLALSGVDLPTVKKLMGHADFETTMIYSHLADEHVDRAVERLRL